MAKSRQTGLDKARAFAARVRDLRRGKFTQVTLAAAVGCTQGYISRIERGEILPEHVGSGIMAKLILKLGTSSAVLMHGLEVAPDNRIRTPDEEQLLADYRALGEHGRRAVLQMAEGLRREKGAGKPRPASKVPEPMLS